MLLLASVIAGIKFGGVQAVNYLLMDAARAAGIDGAIIALHDPPDAAWHREWTSGYGASGSKLRFARAALARREHARDAVIMVTHIGLTAVGRMVKQSVPGARLTLFLHGVEAWEPLPAYTRWGLRACDRVLSVSQFTLDKFRAANPHCAHLPGDICYLPARNLGDMGKLNEPHEPQAGEIQLVTSAEVQNGAAQTLRVLIVGRLWGRGLKKGQAQLINIWERVRARFPSAELWIVGDGDGRAELEALAQARGVGAAVKFTGAIDDARLDELYRAASIYAMPSRGEGFGLVFAEAMARGLPCIASRLDAGREVVADGVTGLHVDPDDEEEILRAVTRLLTDAELRRKMGAAGRQRAAELFSLDAFNARAVAYLK